jgi:hypothetical protein
VPIETITGNSGGAVGPDGANNINIVGAGVVSVAGNAGTHTLTISVGGSVAISFVTDAGTATPALGVLDIFGAHGINTSGATNVVTVAVNNTLTLGDLAAVGANSPSLTLTTGDLHVLAGNITLPATGAAAGIILINGHNFVSAFGTGNTFVGSLSGNLSLTGNSNAGFGSNALAAVTSGSDNTAVGFGALADATSGGSNTAVGELALNALLTGASNIAIGVGAGGSYTGAEGSNIVIGNTGVLGESNTIRIGTTGGGAGDQNECYIAGITGVNVGSVASVVSISGDHLGSTTITAGTGITVTPGANTITISGSGTTTLTYTNVNTTPYVVLAADEYLSVDASGSAITVQLPNAATLGRVFVIKDRTGSAGTRNITVTTVGGAVTIDGATTFVMNTNYQSIEVIGNGTSYEIY